MKLFSEISKIYFQKESYEMKNKFSFSRHLQNDGLTYAAVITFPHTVEYKKLFKNSWKITILILQLPFQRCCTCFRFRLRSFWRISCNHWFQTQFLEEKFWFRALLESLTHPRNSWQSNSLQNDSQFRIQPRELRDRFPCSNCLVCRLHHSKNSSPSQRKIGPRLVQ